MQKLFRATAVSPRPVLSASSWLRTGSKPYRSRNPNPSFSFSMPASSSFHLNPPNPCLHRSTNPRPRSSLVVCRCGNASLKWAWTPPLRPSATWRGFRAVEGLRNHEKGGILSGFSQEEKKRKENDGSETEEENDEDLNEKKSESPAANSSGRAVYRRQKGALTANVDLLMIPGVGPRNLRKLVNKGFEEVAQLKQLYRDKV